MWLNCNTGRNWWPWNKEIKKKIELNRQIHNPISPFVSNHLFSAPWKQRAWRFSDVFRGYRKSALGINGLNIYNGTFWETAELTALIQPLINRMTKRKIKVSTVNSRLYLLKLHYCRFENFPRHSCWYENNTLEISHS